MRKIIALLFVLVAACLFTPARPAPPPLQLYPIAKNDKWGYMDETGRIRIAPQFDSADGFSDERARVSLHGKGEYIDTSGNLIPHPPFDLGGNFSEGLAPINVGQERIPNIGLIKNPGRWGYINTSGALVIPMQFQLADEFYEGLAAAHLGKRSGFIDRTGRFVFDAPFDVSWGFNEGIVLVKSNLKMIYLDRAGRRLQTPTLDDNYYGHSFHDGLAAIQIKDKWGFMDKRGRLVIPAKFIDVGDFSEGLAAAEVPIDQDRETPCQFDATSSYTVAKKFGYIDRTGRMVIPPQWEYAGPFVRGLANVSTCNKASFIDKAGRAVIKTQFNDASPFYGALARVYIGAEIGYIDKTGKTIWEPTK
ncbi:MAG TPA: WG repeat-containing protein [Pyrinomonadaceae bacterium]|nr:WG repeat-containing protein [Pyrinomonadaceae bacterium]